MKEIKAAAAAAQQANGQPAVAPTLIPGHGTFAIYVQGGAEHGLWQKYVPVDAVVIRLNFVRHIGR